MFTFMRVVFSFMFVCGMFLAGSDGKLFPLFNVLGVFIFFIAVRGLNKKRRLRLRRYNINFEV